VRYRLLGTVQAWREGAEVDLGGPKPRAVLATLLLAANKVVPTHRMIGRVWGAGVPATAQAQLHTHISRLRKHLGHNVILRQAAGYLIKVDPGELDLEHFTWLVGKAREHRQASAATQAVGYLDRALKLWSGQALGGTTDPLLSVEGPSLEEQRLAAMEDRVDGRLALGGNSALVGEIRSLVQEYPLRERFHGQLMLALYHCGRQADALKVFQNLRDHLVKDFGLDPGPELTRLRSAILRADPALDPVPAGRTSQGSTPPPPAPAQLPQDVATFTGRERQLGQLDRLLADADSPTWTAVIDGTAGTGKTALAIRWAHRMREHFPDGQLYADLRGHAPAAPAEPAETLAKFVRSLGVPEERIPADLDELTNLYRSLLAGKRMLVVLDDADTAQQVRPLLPGASGCRVLVTSRTTLYGLAALNDARRLALDVLADTEAKTLVAHIIGDGRVRAEPEAASELVRLCAHLPLALRITAVNLASNPARSIADYVAMMTYGNRFAAMEVDGDEASGVLTAFDLSYQRLSPDAQRLFRLLADVADPHFTSRSAATIANITRAQAEQLLGQLADANLVRQHVVPDEHYTFHDLLRQYAKERPKLVVR
jgi:DNA-binding SARP family transcriptional activator